MNKIKLVVIISLAVLSIGMLGEQAYTVLANEEGGASCMDGGIGCKGLCPPGSVHGFPIWSRCGACVWGPGNNYVNCRS